MCSLIISFAFCHFYVCVSERERKREKEESVERQRDSKSEEGSRLDKTRHETCVSMTIKFCPLYQR